ncbi:MAG: polysaccharide deacetylase family protein [Chloroflexota bacterium]|nr:polysaccharide deacetylase family protein [Chloroflexota bacterium]
MQPNPILKNLGFSNDDRVVIIHTDDIGMCQASVEAFAEMVDFGLISSGAVMVPCPWFLEAAAFTRAHPEADMGVHLTLTSEWETYRWGPISTQDPESGLMDQQGFFHRSSEAVWKHADPDAAIAELDAQVSRALAEGMTLTHIDTHMGSVAHPTIIPGYVQLATKYGLPPMIPRQATEVLMNSQGVDAETAQMVTGMIHTLEEMGIPLLDHLSGLELVDAADRFEQAKQALGALKPGVTHFIIHPSKDTPELRHITDSWDCRVADFETFTSEATRTLIKNEGIHVIGYRDLKALMPSFE